MKRSRKYATKLKNDLKRDFFRKSLKENQGNSKGLWNTINQAFGKNKASQMPISNINGETDPVKMAEQLNNFFTTIADKLAADFPSGTPARTEKVCHQPKFTLRHVTDSDVEQLIKDLSISTAVGVDGISPRILKAATAPLSILLSHLINKSIDHGVFPDDLKIARVSPVFKSGDRSDPSNYRPISSPNSVQTL